MRGRPAHDPLRFRRARRPRRAVGQGVLGPRHHRSRHAGDGGAVAGRVPRGVPRGAATPGTSGVVCVTLSSGLSATYQSACTAAEAVADRIPVRVVDTLSVTMGQGLLVLAAADLAAERRRARRHRGRHRGHEGPHPRLRRGRTASTTCERGGRIGGAAKLVGSLLSIKPVIEVRDGVVEVESKQRTGSRSLQYLANKAIEAGTARAPRPPRTAWPPRLRPSCSTWCAKPIPSTRWSVGELGPVVGSHAGPGLGRGVLHHQRALSSPRASGQAAVGPGD